MKRIKLNNGLLMPQEGFGVYQIPDYGDCKQAVMDALSLGYRLLDTAQAYKNEEAVGDAIVESNVDRNDIFLTTKIWVSNYGFEKTQASFNESLKKLNTDYVDLVLLHQPLGDYYGAYRALEQLYQEGKIKAIGVSNFAAARYVDLVSNVKVIPAVNQIETHVFNQEQPIRPYLKEYGTQIESWGPFAEGKNHLFTNETLVAIGEHHDKSAAQVALRFLLQSGVVIIPKSTHIERMKQNLAVWDFELSAAEMKKIQALDENKSFFVDYSDPQFIKALNSWEV
ncbi:aldo/keto reductase (plasmid) [Nicoliella spurrieriana]|uniref:Aldo/keto reductase n=1 Tax=Nicoliella spurrieriana TaxID=2925830 RepID=A0A976RQL0_9LACO|nr:aldo/keto reductase [Nicoliella spurrieriana]UQS86045.1 aldo/keto reductase [Nicoliella spurrieriana]